MNSTDVYNEKETLEYANYLLTVNAIPNIVITIVYLFLGIVGNSFIIYVYTFATKSNINNKYFILVLAIVDIISCIINCVFTIVIDFKQLNFTSFAFCKILRVFCHVSALLSAFILMIIAIQRYLLVCRPLGKQMTPAWRRICVFISVVLSAILGFPAIIFYGPSPVSRLGYNGTACKYEQKYIGSDELAIYNGVFMLSCVSGIITIFVLYFLVVRQIYRQRQKFPKARQDSNKNKNNSNDLSTTDSEIHSESRIMIGDKAFNTKKKRKRKGKGFLNCLSKVNSEGGLEFKIEKNESTTDSENQVEANTVTPDRRPSDKGLKRNISLTSIAKNGIRGKSKKVKQSLKYHRFSLMFVTITLVCVFAFMPLRSLEFMELSDINFVEKTFGTSLPLYRFLYTSYIINNIANPFIYGLFDKEFRKRLKNIFRKN